METNQNIENEINRAFNSVKNTEPVELPFGFADKVMNKLHTKQDNVRSLFTISPFLKVAAVFVLIFINVFTLRLALSPQPTQSPAQYTTTTINDFVNDNQINDTNEELLTINTPAHE